MQQDEARDVAKLIEGESDAIRPVSRHLSRNVKIGLGTLGAMGLLILLSANLVSKHGARTDEITSLAGTPALTIPADKVEVAPPRQTCARIGESCKQSNCCTFSGYQCYEQNQHWSSCLKTCKSGQPNGDNKSTEPTVQKPKMAANGLIPKFAKPFFKPAPAGPWTCKRTPNLKFARQSQGTTLFCFEVALSTIGPGEAPKFQDPKQIDLVKTQHATKSSIFGCEDWQVFSDVELQLSPGPPVEIFSTVVEFPKPAVRPNTKVWQNTLLYVNVWKIIAVQGRHAKQDWTIKVDTTTVFLPIRLRQMLKQQKQTDAGVYLENCKYVRYGFHGSLEVVDQRAAIIYAQHADGCLEELPWDKAEHAHFSYAGEDKFMQRCMDLHKVDRIPSTFEIANDGVGATNEGLHMTITCPAHLPKLGKGLPKKWTPPCNTTKTAAMHPFKDPKLYFTCLKETQMIDTHTDEESQWLID